MRTSLTTICIIYVTYLENSDFILQLCFLFGWEALFVDDFDSYISSTFTMNAYEV